MGSDGDELPDVPPEIGIHEDWDLGRRAMREGYQAFVDTGDPVTCPYLHGPNDSFSGYKRRKEKCWDAGFAIAAIREDEYGSLEEVRDEFDVRTSAIPNKVGFYHYTDGSDDLYPPEDLGQYAYRANGSDIRETRHEAVGDGGISGRTGGITQPSLGEERDRMIRLRTRTVTAFELVRPPYLPRPDDDATGDDAG